MFFPPQQLEPGDFPPLLREITDPPDTLRLRGSLPDDGHRFLAVVGSRNASRYGRDACELLLRGLAGHPIVVVSGLALGIDGVAHRAALKAGIPTIAVPGSGLADDVLYPAAHRGLAHEILEAGGALLSEYEDDFRAAAWSFPKRNRIMAGLANAVLVIEARERSGTLITSRLATEYNRDVLAVPGPIMSEFSRGPHMLIRLGATPITSSDDILEALGLEVGAPAEEIDRSLLSPIEREIVALLAAPIARDELIRQLAVPAQEANTALSALELKGVIEERYGELRLRT